jgi:hypothetical protein
VVSAKMGPFAILEGPSNKGKATTIQRILVPWLISKHGLSYKAARMEVVMQMVEAIIDQENWLELGCSAIMLGRRMQSDSILSLEMPRRQQVCLL